MNAPRTCPKSSLLSRLSGVTTHGYFYVMPSRRVRLVWSRFSRMTDARSARPHRVSTLRLTTPTACHVLARQAIAQRRQPGTVVQLHESPKESLVAQDRIELSTPRFSVSDYPALEKDTPTAAF